MVNDNSKMDEINRDLGRHAAECCDFIILVGATQAVPIYNGVRDKEYPLSKVYIAKNLQEALSKMNEIITKEGIKVENMIYEIRGKQVMLDSDVSSLFGYETKYLNRQVQRNINRFPENYCFQLTEEEYVVLRCQIGTLKQGQGQHRKYFPYVFTEYGITMLAGILKSDTAVEMSLKIVNTFIAMKKYISNSFIEQKYINKLVLEDHERINLLQESFDKFEEKTKVSSLFFEGQIYDAYSKIQDIFKSCKKSLIHFCFK